MPQGRVFLEETFLNHALSTQDPSGDEALALLERRLWRRLALRGLKVTKVHHVERCRIRMDVPPPAPSRALAFGASAGMVHPATGFMVSAAAAAAPKVAQALAQALPQGGPAATAAAWDALWPQAQRQTWELYRFGAKALLDMDTPQVQAFFHAFFQLPPAQRRAYLSRSQRPEQLAQTMWRTFWRCPWGLRWRLQRAALLDPRPVARGCFGVGLPKTSP
jgi:lycopene cyclase-like protein